MILSEQFLNIVLESFKETKKEIGKDVSVISFDSNLVESLAPNITTISQPVNDVKKNLTQLIINKLQNINSNNYYLYKSKLIKKKSVINIVKKTLIKN